MDVWDIALGFMDAQILLTAEELGVFRALGEGPRSAEEVAGATGLPEDSARRLLTALCAMRLVEKASDGVYANGPEADEKLVPGKPGYVGAMFHHLRTALYPVWGHFKAALKEGGAQWGSAFPDSTAPNEGMYSDPHALRSFMEGMHGITYAAAAEFAGMAPELETVRHLTDVGGASGAFLIALAQSHSNLRGTLYDLPPVRPVAEEFIRRSGLEDRLTFFAGDFWEGPIPAGSDAYSLGFILHDWDEAGGSILLKKIANACPPGGLLIIGEYLLNDEGTGPLWVARSDLNMMVAARGRERSAPEYEDWVAEHGFRLERIYQASGGKHFLVARRC